MTIQPYIVVLEQNTKYMSEILNQCIDSEIDQFYFRFVYPPIFSHDEERNMLDNLKEFPAQFQVPIDYSNLKNWKHYDQYQRGKIIREDNITYTFVHNFCHAYWDSLTILHTGDTVGCAKHTYMPWDKMMSYSVGNIMTLEPKEIIRRCQEKIKNSNLEMCLPKY